ncbi:MAG: histidinol-phosphatase HisJ family protein [Lachnospiraceae bacterium]|nr:histidinol-phosphatase HisJ family protein [Lachnospiraceae bacterium]
MITADFHTHTHHSGDSDAAMDAMIESAISRGLRALCFTEHQDFDFPVTHEPEGTFDLDAEAYRTEYLSMRERFSSQIDLYFGVELGLQPSCTEKNVQFVRAHDFDFVIGSVHIAKGRDPYHREYLEQMGTKQRAMAFYLDAMYENLTLFDDFDVLGHLDLANRYWGTGNWRYDYEDHKERIDDILRLLIRKEKGLDCNTNLLWKSGADEMNPSNAILCRFHALGGRILTFGSDAHDPSHVADAFEKARLLAKEAGFDQYCTFSGRRVQFHPL